MKLEGKLQIRNPVNAERAGVAPPLPISAVPSRFRHWHLHLASPHWLASPPAGGLAKVKELVGPSFNLVCRSRPLMETGPQEHKMSQIQGDGGDGRGSKWHALGVCRMAGCHTPACPGVGMGVGGGGGEVGEGGWG